MQSAVNETIRIDYIIAYRSMVAYTSVLLGLYISMYKVA